MTGTPSLDFLQLPGVPAPVDPRPPGHEAQRGSARVSPGPLPPENYPAPNLGGAPESGGNNVPTPKNGGDDFLALNRVLENAYAGESRAMIPEVLRAPRPEDDPEYALLSDELKTFLRVLGKSGSITRASELAGLNRTAMYRLRKENRHFRKLWKQALKYRGEFLEDVALHRAVHGVEEPVFYMGAICGYKRVYSDSLLSKLLEGNMPEKYRHNHKVEVDGKLGVATLVLPATTTAEQWAKQNSGTIIDQLPDDEFE